MIYVVGNLVLITGIIVLLWRENVWVGLGITVFAMTAMVAMLRLQTIAMPWWKEVRAKRAEFFGFLGEQLGGTEDIRASGAVPYMIHRFTKVMRDWLPSALATLPVASSTFSCSSHFSNFSMASRKLPNVR